MPIARWRGAVTDAVRRLDEAGIAIDDIATAAADPRRRVPRADRAAPPTEAEEERAVRAVAYELSDMWVLAVRSAKRIPRQPDLLIGFTVQPLMFVLLFVYVFGGAISTPGFSYVDYLIPGIIVQTMAFGGFVTALGLVRRPEEGADGPLPVAADVALGRPHGPDARGREHERGAARRRARRRGCSSASPSRPASPDIVAGIALLLLIGYSFSWVFAFVGLTASSPEAANAYGFIDPLPADVRLVRLRAGEVDAELAPAGRREQPVHDHGQRRPRAVPRDPGRQRRLARRRVVGRRSPLVFAALAIWRYRRVVAK